MGVKVSFILQPDLAGLVKSIKDKIKINIGFLWKTVDNSGDCV